MSWTYPHHSLKPVLDLVGDRYQHVARTSVYTLRSAGVLQVEGEHGMTLVVIYESDDGETWVRPLVEWTDGRFVHVWSPSELTRLKSEWDLAARPFWDHERLCAICAAAFRADDGDSLCETGGTLLATWTRAHKSYDEYAASFFAPPTETP